MYLIRKPVISRQVHFVNSRQIFPKGQAYPDYQRPGKRSSTLPVLSSQQKPLHLIRLIDLSMKWMIPV